MKMEQYSGNKEPFLLVLFSDCSQEAAEKIIALLGTKQKLSYSSSYGKREKQLIRKAAAVVLILEKASVFELEQAVAEITRNEKEIIPIVLDDAVMSPGMDMLLGTKQILFRKNYESEESFHEAITSSPVLKNLKITPAQTAAAKRLLIGSFAAGLAAAGLFIWIIRGGLFGQAIRADSSLGKLGLSGNPGTITSVYVYGDAVTSAYEPAGSVPVSVMEENGLPGLYLPEADREVGYGELFDASDFRQLQNLEELSLAGNLIEDLSPLWSLRKLRKLDLSNNRAPLSLQGIGALAQLEEVNLSGCEIEDGLEELRQMSSLKKVNVSGEYLALLADSPFEVICGDITAATFEELKNACADRNVYTIRLSSPVRIPKGESLEISRHVSFLADAPNLTVRNNGEIHVFGTWAMGGVNVTNNGTIVIEDGGSYLGGMRQTANYGTCEIRKGGEVTLDRGDSFLQNDGVFHNSGTWRLYAGGQFIWNGGSVINDGELIMEETERENLVGNQTEMGGGGTVTTVSLGPEEHASSPSDSASVDEYGMTPEEREAFDQIVYVDYAPGIYEHPYPVVDERTIEAKGSPRECTFYIARTMTLNGQPSWVDYLTQFQLIVGPGATLTLEGEDWNTGSNAVTVMPDATLVINGSVPLEIAANHGEVIVNGDLNGDRINQWKEREGFFANNGILTVSGTCRLFRLYTFRNGKENGTVIAEERYDYSDTEPPFLFTNGMEGFVMFMGRFE